MDINYKIQRPDKDISDFVESFWFLENPSEVDKEIIVIPDGRVDVFFSYSAWEPFKVVLMGLEDEPAVKVMKAKTNFFAVSLNLLAVEYLLNESISDLLNKSKLLPNGFLEICENDIVSFDSFCAKATASRKIQADVKIDDRKRRLFNLIYSYCGTYSVGDLSEGVFLTPGQINRYFNQQFGMPLKPIAPFFDLKHHFVI